MATIKLGLASVVCCQRGINFATIGTMAWILGLDVGDKKIGLALAEDSVKIATPTGSFEREKGEAEAKILNLIKEKSIATVVVGLPLNDDGEETEQSSKTRSFCRRLERRADISIVYIDENSTSEEAKHRLNLAGSRASRVRGVIDAVSASIILQNYFDNR